MVDLDVERLEIHANLVRLCQFDTFRQGAIHGAELHSVGKLVVVIDDDATISQSIGVDRDRLGTDGLRRLQGCLECLEVGLLLLRVNKREIIVAIKATDRDACSLGCRADLLEVADAPVPKFDGLKAVSLSCGEAVFKRDFRIQCINAGTTFHE